MIWFISDTHFGHNAVISFNKRPFSNLEEMHEVLIKRWNGCVKSQDTIYVLGDLALCPFKEFEPIAKRLNGHKILVRGNHDHYSESQYARLGFKVFHEIKMKLSGKVVRLSHYPYELSWWKKLFAFKSELRYLDRRPPKIKDEWLLHGHSHVKYKKADKENRIHVGVDANDYYPISARDIESIMNKNK